MTYFKIISLVLLVFTGNVAQAQQNSVETEATYFITVRSGWNAADHVSLPSGAHFSNFITISHNRDYHLAPMGEIATQGLENLAELGQTNALVKELLAKPINIHNHEINSGFSHFERPYSFNIRIKVKTSEEAFLSLASMVAPSPDWFVALRSLKIYDPSTGFVNSFAELPLYALDAGTEGVDKAGNFTIHNNKSDKKGFIRELRHKNGFKSPFLLIKIQKLSETN